MARPVGSTTRPRLDKYFTKKEIEELVQDIKQAAKEDNKLKQWLGEQIFGKPPQSVELPGSEGEVVFRWKQ